MGTRTVHALCVLLFVQLAATMPLGAQTRPFHGIYLGAEVGREDLIGGSYVDGVDFLTQETRGVLSLVAGARYQTAGGLVVGLEGTVGSTNGDLTLSDSGRDLQVEYANDTQTSIGGLLGYAFPRSTPLLLFAYASEVTRHFDVRVTQEGSSFDQKDKQGMLRFGVGAELGVLGALLVRARVGTGRADFGNAETNIRPDRKVQFGFGVVYQF
jgi:hypothetical protein